ncbi:hypothetical protein ACTA71_003987 [Dictyostelium dimigraforme]
MTLSQYYNYYSIIITTTTTNYKYINKFIIKIGITNHIINTPSPIPTLSSSTPSLPFQMISQIMVVVYHNSPSASDRILLWCCDNAPLIYMKNPIWRRQISISNSASMIDIKKVLLYLSESGNIRQGILRKADKGVLPIKCKVKNGNSVQSCILEYLKKGFNGTQNIGMNQVSFV